MPGDEKRNGPATTTEPPQVVPPTSTTESLPHEGDPRPVGELLAAWVGAKLAEVDDLVDEAHSRVEAIPDQRVLWSLVGEVIVLLHSLELEVADLRKATRR